MKNLSNGALIGIWIMSGILLIFTGFHTFNFLQMTMPPEMSFMAIFGLVALDGGQILWLLAYQHKGIGGAQRQIALSMIIADMLGSALTFIADTLYNTGSLGITIKMDQNTMLGVIIGVSLFIVLNIAMGFLFKIVDPNSSADRAFGDAKAKMHSASLKHLSENMDIYAQEMAPEMASSIIESWRVDDQINIAERRKRANQLASTAGLNSGKPQLPARKPAPVEPPYSDSEEQETWQAEQDMAEKEKPARKPAPRRVILADLPANPTQTRNGKQHA